LADDVNIQNVGGDNGVASEVTLERLVKSIEKLAKNSGLDPKAEAAKVQKEHTKAVNSDIEVVRESTKEQKEYTDAVKASTRALGSLAKGLIGMAASTLGALTGSMSGVIKELNAGSRALTDYVQHLPIAGEQLSQLTGVIDSSFDAFQSMAKAGGAFNYSLTDMRIAAKQAGMDLMEYSSFINQNSDIMASFGGTVTKGAKQISQMTSTMADDTREQLIAMGLTVEEVTEQMAYYQTLDRAGARTRLFDAQQQAEAAAGLTKNMLTLSKLTGKDVQSMQDKLAANQADVAFQMKIAKMEDEERQKFQKGLNEAQELYGDAGALFYKQQVLGMPALTRETQMLVATMPGMAAQLSNMATTAGDANVTLQQFEAAKIDRMVKGIAAAAEAAGGMEHLLDASAAGLDGEIGIISDVLNGMGIQFTKYIKTVNGVTTFEEDKLREDIIAAQQQPDSNKPANELITSMAESRDAFYDAAVALEKDVISPLIDTAGPLVKEFASLAGEFTESAVFDDFFEGVRTTIEKFRPMIADFIEAFKHDPKQAVVDMFSNITDAMLDVLLGPNTKTINTPSGPQEVDIEREGGLVYKMWDAVAPAMIEGVKYIWENTYLVEAMAAGVVALWAAPAVIGALASAITARMAMSALDLPGGRRGGKGMLGRLMSGTGNMLKGAPAAGGNLLKSLAPFARIGAAPVAGLTAALTPTEMADGTLTGPIEKEMRIEGITVESIGGMEAWAAEVEERLQIKLNDMSQIDPNVAHITGAMIPELQQLFDNVNQSLSGVNVYWGREWKGRQEDREKMANLINSIQNYAENAEVDLADIPEFAQIVEKINTPRKFDSSTLNAAEKLMADKNPDLLDPRKYPQYNNGTQGFENFGNGTLAMLHGMEAVVPIDSPLGKMISDLNSSTNTVSFNRTNSDIEEMMSGLNRSVNSLNFSEANSSISKMMSGLNRSVNKLDFSEANSSISEMMSGLNETTKKLNFSEFDDTKEDTKVIQTESKVDLTGLTSVVEELKSSLSNTMSTASQASSEQVKELNTTMQHILAILTQQKELDVKIERNTSGITGNIARGRVSNI